MAEAARVAVDSVRLGLLAFLFLVGPLLESGVMPLVPKRKVHEEQLRQRKEEAERQPPSARRMRTMRFAPWCSPTASTRPCSGLTAPIGPASSVANWVGQF